MTPISLLASMTLTSSVSSWIASATFCGSSQPALRAAMLLDIEQRHLEAAAGQAAERIEHGLVLGA